MKNTKSFIQYGRFYDHMFFSTLNSIALKSHSSMHYVKRLKQ